MFTDQGNQMLLSPPGDAKALRLGPNGYWIAAEDGAVSYPEEGNSTCFEVEESSFWFKHRNRVIVEAVCQFPPCGPLLDVGGGNGFVSVGLEKAGFETILVEPGKTGAENACRRGLNRVICGTVEAAGFPPKSVSAVGLFDVLEHIEDDVAFLKQLRPLMQPAGRIYLTVPAFAFLWSSEDEFAGHFRRYTRKSLASALAAARFEVEYLTYFFSFLPLPVFMLRTLPYRLGLRGKPSSETTQKEHAGPQGIAGRVFNWILSRERKRVARRRSIPFGGSCLAVARRL